MRISLRCALGVIVFSVSVGLCTSHNDTQELNPDTGAELVKNVGEKLRTVWNWAEAQERSGNSFVGRCFGIGKRIARLLPFLMFLLGAIAITLKFLTIFSLKSLALLAAIFVLNVGGLVSKLTFFKSQNQETYHQPPQNIHFHVNNEKQHYVGSHSGPGYDGHGWEDRINEGLSKTTSLSEKLELLNLYKRLGFNVHDYQML